MTYEYKRVTCEWLKSAFEWHTITYEYIRVTYIWYTSTCEWHTNDEHIRVAYEWHTNTCKYMPMTCEYKQVIYVQYNDALVSVQYNAALAIIGAIQSISKERCIKN